MLILTLLGDPTKDRLIKWEIMCDSGCVLRHQDAEDRDHLFSTCKFTQEVYYYVVVVFSFPWPFSFANAVQLMSKLSKRKSVQARVIVMSGTEIFFQLWLQRNWRIFEGPILVSWHVAKNVLFYVASKLDDGKKASLIYSLVSCWFFGVCFGLVASFFRIRKVFFSFI